MSVRYKHSDCYNTYFVTFTCYKWLHLFEEAKCYDSVYKWFVELKKKNIKILSYVIMPNHLHCILYFPNGGFNLNNIVSNAKRFLAYEIVERLRVQQSRVLADLANEVSDRERKKGQKHKVFKESFDAKAIFSDKFLFQKMEYIHLNPVKKKWALSPNPESYLYSSAAFYYNGIDAFGCVSHFRNV